LDLTVFLVRELSEHAAIKQLKVHAWSPAFMPKPNESLLNTRVSFSAYFVYGRREAQDQLDITVLCQGARDSMVSLPMSFVEVALRALNVWIR